MGRVLPVWQRIAFDVAVTVATVALILAAVTVWRSWQQWDPLGDYPVQRVVNTLPGYNFPAVRVADEVTIEGQKCNATNGKVNVRGGSRWVEVDPAGWQTPYLLGQAVRLPGCTRLTYTSPLPPEVKDRVVEQCKRGRCETVWREDGYEVPVDDHGREGTQRLWFTGNFTIIVPS